MGANRGFSPKMATERFEILNQPAHRENQPTNNCEPLKPTESSTTTVNMYAFGRHVCAQCKQQSKLGQLDMPVANLQGWSGTLCIRVYGH